MFSLYLPNAAHGPEPFAQAIDDFYRDTQDIGAAEPGICLIGGSDANTTLRTTKGTVGPFVGPSDGNRAGQERTDMVLHLLASLGLKAATTCAERQKTRQSGNVIDYVLTS